jgi:vacuolar-type H+-ATPase subunit I/STV1
VIAIMNLKIIIMIPILLALALPIAGMDALYLGSGLSNQVINLDAGARQPGQTYSFAATGFVAPRMPQVMSLSPNIMITQAKKLMEEAQVARDESVSAREDAKAILNETQALLAEINKKEQNIQSLQKIAESDRKATAGIAAQAGVFLNRTEEVYNKTQALSMEIEGNLRQINDTLQEVKAYAYASANASAVNASSFNASLHSPRARLAL